MYRIMGLIFGLLAAGGPAYADLLPVTLPYQAPLAISDKQALDFSFELLEDEGALAVVRINTGSDDCGSPTDLYAIDDQGLQIMHDYENTLQGGVSTILSVGMKAERGGIHRFKLVREDFQSSTCKDRPISIDVALTKHTGNRTPTKGVAAITASYEDSLDYLDGHEYSFLARKKGVLNAVLEIDSGIDSRCYSFVDVQLYEGSSDVPVKSVTQYGIDSKDHGDSPSLEHEFENGGLHRLLVRRYHSKADYQACNQADFPYRFNLIIPTAPMCEAAKMKKQCSAKAKKKCKRARNGKACVKAQTTRCVKAANC